MYRIFFYLEFNLPRKLLIIGLTISLSSKRSSSLINSSSTALSNFHILDFFSPKLSVTLEPIYINCKYNKYKYKNYLNKTILNCLKKFIKKKYNLPQMKVFLLLFRKYYQYYCIYLVKDFLTVLYLKILALLL